MVVNQIRAFTYLAGSCHVSIERISMKTTRAVLALVAICVAIPLSAATQSEKKKRPSKLYTIEQFMETVTVRGASFSPDEKEILFSSNEKDGIFNAYTVTVAGGPAKALTTSKTDTTYAVSFFPGDRRILYTRDESGNEENHLYVRELDGSERDLTPGKDLKASFAGWSRDEKSFYVATNERDPKFFDLYEYDAKSYERSMLFKNEVGYEVAAISGDERWLALDRPNTTTDGDVFLYDLKEKRLAHITKHEGIASWNASEFDPSSKHLYLLSNEGSEFTEVKRYELATGKMEPVEKAKWDVMYTTFSENGKYRVTGINEDGRNVIRLWDVRSGKQISLPKLPDGDVAQVVFSPSETKMAMYVVADRAPRNLFVHDFKSGRTTRLTDTLSKDVDPMDLVDSEVVRFKSFDGMVIPGILYKPHQASADAKAPAVVMVHGGPGGQAREGYNSLLQFLANHGYVVLDVNNRGSSGYGKTFFMADDGKHGREPLWDVVEAKTYLSSLPYVDGNRIGIMGGSYGGYMVAAALAFKPDVFDAGVDIFGVTNWVRTLQSIPPYWEAMRKALYQEIGDPDKQLDFLRETSPLFHAEKIRKPLLVVQGANDPRVLKVESDELVAAVKKNGVPVEYLVFDDEGHGFSKKKNQSSAWSTILKFLDAHLKGKKVGA
jgi:dipeptidyl aminopeptidase/acylaminoacyl peptidase